MKCILICLIKFYRIFISPCFKSTCRYSPTCSTYALEAITKYGALKGGFLSFKRISRCHPYSKHEWYDPVP